VKKAAVWQFLRNRDLSVVRGGRTDSDNISFKLPRQIQRCGERERYRPDLVISRHDICAREVR